MPEVVIKIGGSLLASVDRLDGVLDAAVRLARVRRVLIVPGGGPFADVVRDVDRRVGLPWTAAHWMAVLAMEQYAHLLASRIEGGMLVPRLADAVVAIDTGYVPVLAPYRWLAEADPLPHTWEVTSDSIAAWIAGQAGATHVVLVKPSGAEGDLVDGYFARALPPQITSVVVRADEAPAAFERIGAGSG